jgi:DNA-binding CsgD family transcriptional regulator
MQAPDRLADLLGPLIDGGFEDPPWATFLERLRLSLGADYASLFFRRPGKPLNAMQHLYAGEAAPQPLSQLYDEQLYETDPLPYDELKEGRPYALEEMLRPGDPVHDAYYRDFLAPAGLTAGGIMRVREPSGVNVWLAISRRTGGLPASDAELMRALAPYLRSVLRSFVALERERYAASLADEAIRRLDFGWLALDASARVLDADAQGLRLLEESAVLGRRADGRLAARPRALQQEILQAVAALAADPRTRPRAIILSRDPWLDMLLVSARNPSISAKPDPAVVAYVHGDSWSSADRCDQLADLFGLTASEARLALALSRGLGIGQAAGELGLTVETARNYSKKIYAKLGARGQADVVRHILRSVLAIA